MVSGSPGDLRVAILLALLVTAPFDLRAQELNTTGLWDLFHAAALGEVGVEPVLAEVELLCRDSLPKADLVRLDAYEGALRTMSARETAWPPAKLSRARAGLSLLDDAVASAPGDPEVRYLRLVISHHLPGLFRRGEVARADAAALATLLLSGVVPREDHRTVEMVDFLVEKELVADSIDSRLEVLRRSGS